MLTNPLWLINMRLKQQARGIPRYRGTFDALVRITRDEGAGALLNGVGPAMLGPTLGSGLQWGIYETLKALLGGRPDEPRYREVLTPAEYLLIGGTSRLLALLCTYPATTIGARMQLQPREQPPTGAPATHAGGAGGTGSVRNGLDAAAATDRGSVGRSLLRWLAHLVAALRRCDLRDLYRGIDLRLLQYFLQNAIKMYIYELLLRVLRRIAMLLLLLLLYARSGRWRRRTRRLH